MSLLHACEAGDLEEVIRLVGEGADVTASNNAALRCACEEGHLKVAEWIWSLRNEVQGINITAEGNYALRWACANGHLLVAVWIWNLKRDVDGIDITGGGNYALRWACANGHLGVATWIWSLRGCARHSQPLIEGIDIATGNNWTLRCVCERGHVRVLQWMLNLVSEDAIARALNGQYSEEVIDEINLHLRCKRARRPGKAYW